VGEFTVHSEPGLPFVDVTREFDAPRDLVFRAHTDPELIRQWLGPEKYEMTILEWDVRHGGRYRYTHRDADGNEYGFRGVFHGEPTPDRFVQTFEFEQVPGPVQLDALTLEERDGRTILRVHSVFQSLEHRDGMVQGGMADGMASGYDRLEKLLEGLKAAV
jgi:uncharacterized protein YndB with AHSA1/START domain